MTTRVVPRSSAPAGIAVACWRQLPYKSMGTLRPMTLLNASSQPDVHRRLTHPLLAAVLGLLPLVFPLLAAGQSRTREAFDPGWRFARFGPMPDGGVRPEPVGLEAPGFDDSDWRLVNTPHDWGIEGPFRAELPNNTGKLPWAGIGWYRKPLELAAADRGRRIFLDFDGAMAKPKVYVNGRLAGEWVYGYNSFRVEVTDFVRYDTPNRVAVRLDNPPDSSRWYPGGGLFRHVWLIKTDAVHVAQWGVFVRTPKVSRDSAEVRIETTVDNQSGQAVVLVVRQEVIAPNAGEMIVQADTPLAAPPGAASGRVTTTLTVKQPRRWDVDSPQLYTLRTTVLQAGREVDRVETPFGIRQIDWTAQEGFLLNGRVVKLQGVCQHHDLGALGAAFNERAAERQLEILREMGCNAIRTAHNPPAPQLLDLCDRLGFLVFDELFDCWAKAKTTNDYSQYFAAWHERDVVNFVRRDRNHPSVILWSTGNEIREQGVKPEGHELSRQLTALFHREDPSRLVSNGMNNAASIRNGFAATLDVAGYNYKAILAKQPNYLDHLEANPEQPFFGSETSSAVSSRGVYFFPVSPKKDGGFFQFQVSSYDLYAPPWANIPDADFDSADRLPTLAGEFVWTGFDYLGEPTPYNKDSTNLLNFQNEAERKAMQAEMEQLGGSVPSRSSYFGLVDLAGFPKDRYYLYQSRWRPELPMAHLLPHWNWAGREGEVTPVQLYTSGDEAELFLNGRSLGRKQKGEREYRLRWDDVAYAPGELKAVAYKHGQPWAETVRRTTGPAVAIKLEADRAELRADGRDLGFITVKVVDANGEVVPTAGNLVKFAVNGPAEIAGVDNGDAASFLSLQGSEMKAFGGLCLVMLRPRAGEGGRIELVAQAEGLPPARLTLTAGTAARVGRTWYDGGDLSALAKIEELGGRFRDATGGASDGLRSLAAQGANCVRLRLFVAPDGKSFVVNDLPYTLALARRAQVAGQALLLDFHYSDTWADPGKQHIPAAWTDHTLAALADRVEAHTYDTLRAFTAAGLTPELVQIGNEIHNGLLWPVGQIWKEKGKPADYDSAAALFRAAARGVRRATASGAAIRIVLHSATGGDRAKTETFNREMQRRGVDYDVVGLSFYPWWHGSIENLRDNCRNLVAHFGKEVMVVETAYLWREGSPQDKSAGKTYAWPKTAAGQAMFLREVIDVVHGLPEGKGIGVVWWHPDAIDLPGAHIWFGGSCALFRPDGTPLPAAAEFARF